MRSSHNSVNVIWRLGRGGGIEFLVVDSIPTHPSPRDELQTKFPGGGDEEGETPEATLRRETKEETGLRIRQKTEVIQIYRSGNGHRKYGFLTERRGCRGSMRKHDLVENDSVVKPPRWMKAGEALKVIHRHLNNESHFHIGLAALERIAITLGKPIESVLD